MSCFEEGPDVLTQLMCVGSILLYQDEAGEIHDFDLSGKFVETLTNLEFNPLTKKLVYSDELGTVDCLDLAALCSTFDYLPGTHTVLHNGDPFQLNCGVFNFNPATCEISYLDEKGNYKSWFIPQDQFIYSAATCTLTILDAKGNPGVVIPTGVPMSEVSLGLAPDCDGCTLRFQYKDKVCDVALPNMVVGCEYVLASNELTMLYCDGTASVKALPKASLDCVTLDNGQRVFHFQDGCGGDKFFDIQIPTMDIDNLQVNGSILTFTFGGDGNPAVVTVDFCDIIANNCNATIVTQYPDGGFDFVDNAGTVFEVRPVNCCTYFGLNPTILDPNSPPGIAGSWPTKTTGDTAIECHPNGLSFWTCVNGAWVLNYIKMAETEVFIGEATPSKDYKVWFNPATCIAQFCDADGNWREPRSVVCQTSAPDIEDGYCGPDLWYDPSTCCLSVKCDGVWVGVTGQIIQALIQALCVQVGSNTPVPVQIGEDGKATIQVPEYCVAVGEGQEPILAEPHPTTPNKFVITLPAFPEAAEPGCCVFTLESTADIVSGNPTTLTGGGPVNKVAGDVIFQKHPNGFSVWMCLANAWVLQWVCVFPSIPTYCASIGGGDPIDFEETTPGKFQLSLPAYPTLPEIPEYCAAIGGGEPIDFEETEDGKFQLNLPAYPTIPEYCAVIGDGEQIDFEETEDGKLQLSLPPYPTPTEAFNKDSLFASGTDEPATDGSEGCFWFNEATGCPHILFGNTWIATNGQDVAA